MSQIVPPNFVSVRLLDADKENYIKIADHMQRTIGLPLAQSDVYRLAMKALAEKHNIKGMQ